MKKPRPTTSAAYPATVNISIVLEELEAAISEYVARRGHPAMMRAQVVMNEWVYVCVWCDIEDTCREVAARAGEQYRSLGSLPDYIELCGVKVVASDCPGSFEILSPVE